MAPTDTLQNYRPRGTFSTWLGVVLLFALFGLIAVVILRAAPRGTDYEKKRAENRMKKLEDAQKEYLATLTTYAWVDKAKGVARIPINDAMQLTLAELAGKKPAAAGPIAAETPAPAAPGASPAASAPAATSPAPASSASATPKPTSVEGPNSEAHNQPAAAANPPAAPPQTQPGPGSSPAASAPPPAAKAPTSPAASASPSAPGTPLPVRGKTP
jgi:hypothetical protein